MASPAAAPTTGPPATTSPPPAAASVPSPPAPATTTPAASPPAPAAESPPPPIAPVASPPPPPTETPPSTPSPPPPTTTAPPPSSSTPTTPSPPSSNSPPPPKSSSSTPSPPPPPSSKSSPPPPPSSSSSPSTPPPSSSSTPSTSSSSTPSSSSSSSVSTSTIVVIAAGIFAFVVVAVLIYCFCCKRRRKKYYAPEYYGPPGGYSGPPGGLPAHAHYKDNYYPPSNRQGWSSSTAGSEVALKPPLPPVSSSPNHSYGPIGPPPPPPSNSGPAPGIANSKSWFTFEELEEATDGFSKSNLLGEGGFGCVYKGVLPDGTVIAVKQLKVGASQGEREFMAEVEIISRVHHRHLVSLVGYCIAESHRLLVYDFVSNGTLEYHLHKRKSGPAMDWPTRLKIACGAARGLAYLHEDCHPRIIHRDIKSANILIDDNFDAQVADFGLAKLSLDTNTHVSTRVMGTFGYLAPEYASSGKLTEKSDVFSFGVVLLELLTGRMPVDASQPLGEESLVEWARPALAQVSGEEDLDLVVDPALEGQYNTQEALRMVEAAAACVRHSASKRPKMGQVVRALEDDISLSDLNKGLRPGHSSVYGTSFASTDYENTSYTADMRKFRKMAFESQEYGSEYSGATSEYGVNPSVSSGEYQRSREMASRDMTSREMSSKEMTSREMTSRPSARTRPPLSVRRTGTSTDFASS